jgi:hypothetical protein
MSDPIVKYEGSGGQFEVYPDKIIITRKGLQAKFLQGFTAGNKTIYINQLTGIKVKPAGILNGYIQFILSGNIEVKKDIMKQTHDENTIFFKNRKDTETIEKIKAIIEDLMSKRSSPSISEADEIKKYKQLLDDGAINQEEFDLKKKQLLRI